MSDLKNVLRDVSRLGAEELGQLKTMIGAAPQSGMTSVGTEFSTDPGVGEPSIFEACAVNPTSDCVIPYIFQTGMLHFTRNAVAIADTPTTPAIPANSYTLVTPSIGDSLLFGTTGTGQAGAGMLNPQTRLDTNFGPSGTLDCDYEWNFVEIRILRNWISAVTPGPGTTPVGSGIGNGGVLAYGTGQLPLAFGTYSDQLVQSLMCGLSFSHQPGINAAIIQWGRIGAFVIPNAGTGYAAGTLAIARARLMTPLRFNRVQSAKQMRIRLTQEEQIIIGVDPSFNVAPQLPPNDLFIKVEMRHYGKFVAENPSCAVPAPYSK